MVFDALREAAQRVVRELNKMGHRLALEDSEGAGTDTPAGLSFRDERGLGSGNECRLRLAFDLTVSAGYAHLISPEDLSP